MKRLLVASAAVLLSACSVNLPGQCSADTDCTSPAVCLTSHDPKICVVPQGACFPACASGFSCISGACISSVCNPACPSSQQCDTTTVTCKDVTQPSVALTSPGDGAFAGVILQATATARAPGGVGNVRFELRAQDGTTVLASATATQPTGTDPANFAAQLSLGGGAVPEGPAKLFAIVNYPAGSFTSASIGVTVDLTAPAITMVSDGRTSFLGPANATATVIATVTDAVAGVDATTPKLTLLSASQTTYTGVAGTGNQFSFAVPLTDLNVLAGATGSVLFKVTASDKVGNAATSTGQPTQILKVDLVKPTLSIATSAIAFHTAAETVSVTGTASDSQSGVASGAAAVALSVSSTVGNLTATGSITSGNYAIPVNLAALNFPTTFEGTIPYTVTLTDAAGNTQTAQSSLSVDNAAPQITAITLPAGDVTVGSKAWFRATGVDLTITATVTDLGSGVDTANVVLQLASGSAGTLAGPISGTHTGNAWLFTLPRTVGTGLSGAAPVQVVIVAKDLLGHTATSAAQSLFFDDVAPVLTKVVDGNWYARKSGGTDVIIALHETIVDAGVGLATATLTAADANNAGATHVTDGTCTLAGDCTFTVDAAFLAAGTEAPLAFTITAKDALNVGADTHVSAGTDTRNVDDKPPAVNISRVTNANAALASTGTSGVTFPTLILNTGYDGAHFVYSDTLTITGTIQDLGAGIAATASSPNFEVDGQPTDGTANGPKKAIISCTDGQTSVCNFTATVKLNDLTQAGAFHASDALMQLVVNSADKAVDAAKAPAANVGSSTPTSFDVTRFWWKNTPGGTTAIGGLAINSSGAVIMTTTAAAGSDTVFALNHDGPLNAAGAAIWHKGANFYGPGVDLGPIDAAPALGAAATPSVYVPTNLGDVVSFDSAGNTIWNCGQGNLIDPVHHTPAIITAAKVGALPNCEAVVAGADNAEIWAVCGTVANSCSPRAGTLATDASSPTIALAGSFYVGAGNAVDQTSLTANGSFAAVNPFTTADTNSFTNVVTDNSEVFAVNNNALKAYAFDKTLTQRFSKVLTSAVTGAPVILPATAPVLGLLFGENSKTPSSSLFVLGETTATPSETGVIPFAKAPSPTSAPLLGSDNRIYADGGGVLSAVNQTATPPFSTDWSFTVGAAATFTAPPTMACDGTLYAASGATVFAFVTDARGLASTPWPKYQRDTRNSGNADAAPLWGANVNGICTQ